MKIERTLKESLRQKADYANTATQVTNRIVKDCREASEEGCYGLEAYIEFNIVGEVLTNLRNELTDLKVEQYVESQTGNRNWYTISWED